MAPSAASMAQFNVCLDPKVKKAGDDTLERVGVTPTQIVRAVWEKLTYGAEAFEQLAVALVNSPGIQDEWDVASQGRGDEATSRIMRRQELFEGEVGLDPRSFHPSTDEEMEALLRDEAVRRERERMAWNAN